MPLLAWSASFTLASPRSWHSAWRKGDAQILFVRECLEEYTPSKLLRSLGVSEREAGLEQSQLGSARAPGLWERLAEGP